MATFVIVLALWTAFVLMYRSEPRRLINAIVLLPAAMATLGAVSELLSTMIPGAGFVLALLLLSVPLMLLIFAFVLIYNGILMWRREGRRWANLLSLIAGVMVLVLPTAAILLIRTEHWLGLSLAFFLFMGSVFTAMIFVMVLLYAWVYARFPRAVTPDAVVVLGSRTLQGQVTPLLRARLDRGLELFNARQHGDLWMVPTGGQGRDEHEPEGVTMARYLRDQGISPSNILVEDRARNTTENLKLSEQLVAQQRPEPRLWLVTNNYHSLRAALDSRRLGMVASAFGSKTARYYLPSAFLREFIAIVREYWVTFAILAVPFAIVLGFSLVFSLNG